MRAYITDRFTVYAKKDYMFQLCLKLLHLSPLNPAAIKLSEMAIWATGFTMQIGFTAASRVGGGEEKWKGGEGKGRIR